MVTSPGVLLTNSHSVPQLSYQQAESSTNCYILWWTRLSAHIFHCLILLLSVRLWNMGWSCPICGTRRAVSSGIKCAVSHTQTTCWVGVIIAGSSLWYEKTSLIRCVAILYGEFTWEIKIILSVQYHINMIMTFSLCHNCLWCLKYLSVYPLCSCLVSYSPYLNFLVDLSPDPHLLYLSLTRSLLSAPHAACDPRLSHSISPLSTACCLQSPALT
mgnify:CR=1 FL=1